MRLVSTALVMMTIALMLLALILLGPAHAKSDDLCSEPNKSPPNNSQTTRALLTSVTMNFGGGEISEAPAFAVPWSNRRRWPARPDLGERWPSRLVATAAVAEWPLGRTAGVLRFRSSS
jgi:hypothetical protein